MNRKGLIPYLAALAVLLAVLAGFALLPKRHQISEHLMNTVAFWNQGEAFVFLTVTATGRSGNAVQQRLESWAYYPYLSLLFSDAGFYRMTTQVYRLRPPDRLEPLALPDGSASLGSFTLNDGRLQSNPPPFSAPGFSGAGFRWNGSEFVAVPRKTPTTNGGAPEPVELNPDDLAEIEKDEDEPSLVAKTEREAFRKAGWHSKALGAWQARGKAASVPIVLGSSVFQLTLEAFPPPAEGARLDPLSYGAKSVAISGDSLSPRSQPLWTQGGWREISQDEFQALVAKHGVSLPQSTATRLWMLALAAIILVRIGQPLLTLVGIATMKRRMLKGMATAYSFPPVSAGQFAQLEQAELDRYTRELENLGFTRLLDLSLVSDAPSHPGNFCRLLAHSKHRCFAEINQIFPNGQAPLPMKCSVLSYLQDGWSVAFTDRKPMAMSSLFRRGKAIGGCLTTATTAGLLEAMLSLRERVATDLAIAPLGEATLDVYMGQMQQSLQAMRAALQGRNLAAGLSFAGLRKLSSLRPSTEHTWLGDYPKLARQRQFGGPVGPAPR